MADELPPLVALVQANIEEFLARMDQASAKVKGLTDTPYVAKLLADTSDADTKLDAVNARLTAWGNSSATATANMDIGLAMARLAELSAAAEATKAKLSSPSLGASFLGAAGGDAGNLGARLLMGGGGGGFLGLPSLGSLGSLAGLGPEHLLTTLGGIGASGIGALGGAGLLGLGAGGTAAVGMGTDLAGIGQASGDIKATTTAMTALNQAVANYGPNSRQAALAQVQLNTALTAFNPIAEGAVYQAAQTAEGFKKMFDQVTGQAEKTGAEIITQLMQVGERFLPVIGQFAAENTKIIQQSLQPFLQWLAGPGLAIFTQLEQKFQSDLPTAMHAMTQAAELLARTIGYISPQTGALTKELDNLFTRMNSPEGWAKWTALIDKLIADFHLWDGLIKTVGSTLYDIFKNDAGTATALIQDIESMLDKLKTYVTSAQGSASLQNLFTVHKQEALALLNLIPPLLAAIGRIELTAGPPLVLIITQFAQAALAVINFMQKLGALGSVFDFVAGLVLILAKLGLLMPAINAAKLAIDLLAQRFIIDGGEMTTAAVASEDGITAALGATGVGAVLVGVAVAAVALVTHWDTAMSALNSAANQAADGIAAAFNWIVRAYNDTLGKLLNAQASVHLSGPTAPQAKMYSISSTSGGFSRDTPLPAGTTAARAAQLQSLVSSGMSLAAAEKVSGGSAAASGPPSTGALGPPAPLPTLGAIPSGGAGGSGVVPHPTGPTAAQSALASHNAALISAGQADQTRLVGEITSQNLAQIKAAISEIHSKSMTTLVGELKGIHSAASNQLVKQLTGDARSAQSALTQEEKAIAQAEAIARINSTVQANHAMQAAMQTSATDVANAAAAFAAASQKIMSDANTSAVDAVNNASTLATDHANATVQAITDASAINIDLLQVANATGLQQVAYQAQLALDQQKAADDAQIAADQLALDTQKGIDQQAIDAAQAHVDQVAQAQAALVAKAQADYDTGAINEQSIVNAATIANAVADAGQNVKLQHTTAQALQNAVNGQTSALDRLGGALNAAENNQTSANQDAADSLQGIMDSATSAEAALQAILSGDQGQAAVLEASLQALLSAANEQVTLAGTTAANTAPVSVAATPILTQVTVVTQVDGQTIALVTTPYIRQQILRTTSRQTQNVFGGSAGRLGPSS